MTLTFPKKVDREQVIQRYLELHNASAVGRELGVTRERVRYILMRAGISTARPLKSKPEKRERVCRECGGPVYSSRAWYCELHRNEKDKRKYESIKADPARYARRLERQRVYDRRRRQRERERRQG
jgi:hypothetical protein